MNALRFDWDPKKAKANLKNHGVSFEEAQSTFYDEWAILYDDPDHSTDEDRFLLLGMSVQLRTLIVSHCYRESESVIRLISARKAHSEEEKEYLKVRK
ncbi:MAG: BrnT family toxin [Xanthomonadales bacterium]|nr:BrnT family toxin [Xanthomonadales bacterium]